MPKLIDHLAGNLKAVYGGYVINRPAKEIFPQRVKDAWLVLIGKADAVWYIEDDEKREEKDG